MRNLREYHRPETIEEALRLLSQEGLDAAPLDGGTQLSAESRAGPEAVIDLSALPLAYVAMDGAVLRIGGLTRLEELSRAPALRAFAGGLVAEAAGLTCTSLLRSQRTVAGTILSRSTGSELLSALLVLDAEVLLHTLERRITCHISELLENLESCRRAILIEVRLPEPPLGSCFNRERIARTPGDQAILSVMAVAQVIGGSIAGCRVAVAGAGIRPMRLRNVESVLAGTPARADVIDSILKTELASIEMPDSTLASTEYRRAMLPVLISRAVLDRSCRQW